MRKHKHYSFTIKNTETDAADKLHMHALFSMLQEAASLNALDYGVGSKELDEINLCWLLLRVSVRMEKMPAWLDEISIETWSRGADRLFFYRDYIIHSSKGEILGRASSLWVIAEKDSHRPVRPSMLLENGNLPVDPEGVFDFNPPKLFPGKSAQWMSENENESILMKFADFSEIDRNKHVNNTRYVAWCIDTFFKNHQDACFIKGIDINFLSEIYYQSKIYLFQGSSSDGTSQIDGYVSGSEKAAFSSILYYDE